jgi:prevent-host-death family protein
MQKEIGIRELKTRLSSYLRQVRAGETIIITDRGRPIGRIVPIMMTTHDQLEVLRSAGLIDWNGETISKIDPVAQITGKRTVAELLIEDRE